jgi:hypothetical protein
MIRASNWARGLVAAGVLLGSARALDLSTADLTLKLRATPEASVSDSNSPFSQATALDGIGRERGRGEVDAQARYQGLTTEVSGQLTAMQDEVPLTQAVLNQLYYDVELLGTHLTVGKKVLSWDVGFGFRPLDVIEQEDRRALIPFSLEGVPLVALERYGSDDAWTLVYANPIRARGPVSREDESVALRYYRRAGPIDLHTVIRYSQRTQFEAGEALSAVLADALELHGSVLYQRRSERLVDSLLDESEPTLATSNPIATRVSRDVAQGLVGATLTPGWNLSFLFEAWLDPTASTADEWKAMADLANRQAALLADSATQEAAIANLAWGATLFDRPNLLRQNLLLHVSGKWDRFEPYLDLLYTPEDGGYVATGALTWEGERSRLEAGARLFDGKTDAAYRLFPQRALIYASWGLHF